MKNITKIVTRILALLLTLALAGCAAQKPEAVAAGVPVWGGTSLQDSNLIAVTASKDGADTVVTLSFAQGSSRYGVPQKAADAPPTYELLMLEDPAVLRVSFPDIQWWDAEPLAALAESLYAGAVMHATLDGLQLWIQLASPAALSVTRSKGELKLRLAASGEPQSEGFRVVREYSPGMTVPEGFAVVICSDGETAVLASALHGTEEAAFAAAMPGDRVARQEAGRPMDSPLWQDEVAKAELALMFTPNGEAVYGQLLQSGARVLCTLPQGGAVLARPTLRYDSQGRETATETLWTADAQGLLARLSLMELQSIVHATWSQDGRYLAILEQGMQAEALYLFDAQTESLTCEAGMTAGWQTAAAAWGEGHTLYTLTQWEVGGPFRLWKHDYSAADDEDGQPVEVGLPDPRILYGANGRIYALDAAEGFVRLDESDYEVLSPNAVSAAISPSGEYAALSVIDINDEDAVSLEILPLTGGAATQIQLNAPLLRMVWDGDALLYALFEEDGDRGADHAVYRLRPGENEPQFVGRLLSMLFWAENGRLFVTYIDMLDPHTLPSAYSLEYAAGGE